MSIKDMAELSAAKWNYNLDLLRSLVKQKADTEVGFSLLLLSFVLQLLHWLLPYGIGDLGIDRRGVILAIIISIAIFFIGCRVSCSLQQKWYTQGEDIFKNKKNK